MVFYIIIVVVALLYACIFGGILLHLDNLEQRLDPNQPDYEEKKKEIDEKSAAIIELTKDFNFDGITK